MQEEQQSLTIKMLYLRQLIRASQNFEGIRLFGRIGIGVVKYEISSNLSQYIKNIKTVIKSSSTVISFSVADKTFQKKDYLLKPTSLDCTVIEQIGDKNLLISGGENDNKKRFTIWFQEGAQEFQMITQRLWHKTSYNRTKLVYILSGDIIPQDINKNSGECEVFNFQSQKFKSIQQIITPVLVFGCDQIYNKVFAFGGLSKEQLAEQDKIQIFDGMTNN